MIQVLTLALLVGILMGMVTGGYGLYREYREARSRCAWTYEPYYDYWDTDCDHPYCTEPDELLDGTFRFCPYCGKRINATIGECDDL